MSRIVENGNEGQRVRRESEDDGRESEGKERASDACGRELADVAAEHGLEPEVSARRRDLGSWK